MAENYGISVSDLLVHPEFKDLQRDPIHPKFNDERALKKVLWELGMDTSCPIHTTTCTHRNLQGQVVTCLRYVGEERCDDSWCDNGYASVHALDKRSARRKNRMREIDEKMRK